jgi:uncharacterized C2H2 Zn-finger protein
MGLTMPYELTCGCGNTFQVKRYDYVFADDFPDVKRKILNGEFYLETCPRCGQILNVENRFLYRDERNRLWVWVCKPEERRYKKRLKEQLMNGDAPIEAENVYDVAYRKYVVFGRDELLALLLREDEALKNEENEPLKKNAAIKLLSVSRQNPGYLFLNGEKVKMISLTLRLSCYYKDHMEVLDNRRSWLDFYAQGLNMHNQFSSFLSEEQRSYWNRVRKERPIKKLRDEYDDFAESWAAYKIRAEAFRKNDPVRWTFLKNVKKIRISRRIVSYRA